MATLLWPATELGAVADDTDHLLLYGNRDPFGVEAVAATPTDYNGANELFAFTRRFEDAATVEHYLASGAHKTLKIPRAVVIIDWDGASYSVSTASYLVSTTGTVTTGSGVATLSRLSAGVVEVTLASAMPSSMYGVMSVSQTMAYAAGVQYGYVWVGCSGVTSTTKFTMKRWASESTRAALAVNDGTMVAALHDPP